MNNILEDYELTLFDRIKVIRDVINKYGEDNFYISFSGGKDSTILHYLVDMAIPENKIPRVFINTGIEYNEIIKFVKELAENDNRFVLLRPSKPISTILREYGYPFKSKEHSTKLHEWQQGNRDTKSMIKYLGEGRFSCPKILKYQFSDNFNIKISQFCCHKLKKEPIAIWAKENKKSITITGMRKEEGGQRITLGCIVTNKSGNIIKFHPLAVISEEWENEFIKDKPLCKLYYAPYNFERTGCKGCPFALNLQHNLDILEKFFPAERQQCEIIWKPIYEEYRRLGYRLRKEEL